MDIALVLEQLSDAKELLQSTMETLKSQGSRLNAHRSEP
jgi:chaperonin cofactor prefoldin